MPRLLGYLEYAQVLGYLGYAQVIWGMHRLFGVCTGYLEAGKQRDLGSDLLRLYFLFKSCVLWTF